MDLNITKYARVEVPETFNLGNVNIYEGTIENKEPVIIKVFTNADLSIGFKSDGFFEIDLHPIRYAFGYPVYLFGKPLTIWHRFRAGFSSMGISYDWTGDVIEIPFKAEIQDDPMYIDHEPDDFIKIKEGPYRDTVCITVTAYD